MEARKPGREEMKREEEKETELICIVTVTLSKEIMFKHSR
jgi:hypothetical protein